MLFAATWMDLDIIILSAMTERERQIPYDITYMWNLNNNINSLITKQIQTNRHKQQTHGYQRRMGKGGIN